MQNPMLQNLSRQPNSPFELLSQIKQMAKGGITPESAKNLLQQKLQSGEISQEQLNSKIQQAQGIVQQMQGFANLFK